MAILYSTEYAYCIPLDNFADRLAIDPEPKDEQPVNVIAIITVVISFKEWKFILENSKRKLDKNDQLTKVQTVK